ncbi:MAG: hypothetical protein E2O72_01795 [Candidatus Dadabacteria bacterium]|nr:MAG: hypothetical protein E2O72_01795 [Candidatus Dadabacteria bacterium]TDI99563.1 MAG: hypothetical protein E2O70_07490 [Candidatus Dadabacteria bacterium]
MNNSINRVLSIILAAAFLGSLFFTGAIGAESEDEKYTTFGRYKLLKDKRFEPSGIARIPDTDDYIVIDDKGPYLSIFELQNNKLHQISKPVIETEKVKVKKLEGITASLKEPGIFYAITAFVGDNEFRKLVRFNLKRNKDEKNEEPYVIENIKELEIYDPHEAIIYKKEPIPWLKVEGLALTPDEKHLLVGVRAIGKNEKLNNKKKYKVYIELYRVIILKYDVDNLNKPPEILVNVDLKDAENLQKILGMPEGEGISSLEYDPDSGKYIVLTSYEDKDGKSKEHVSGHLWLVPEDFEGLNDAANWEQYKKMPSFSHKPEGVSLTSKPGKAIIVFDDDNDRKCINKCKGKFPYKPNEGVFKIVDINSGD